MKLIWRCLWPELKVYSHKLILVMALGILISALKAYTPDLVGRLPEVWQKGDHVKAMQIPVLISVLWIVAAAARYFHLFWMLYISDLVAMALRRQLMNKYLSLNLSFFQNFMRGSGGLISRMLNDITLIQAGIQKVADVVREPFMAAFSFGYLVYLDWRLTIFILIAIPLVTAVSRRFARSLRKYSRLNQESMEDLTQTLKESLDGTRIVQSFNLQDEMRRRFDVQADEVLATRKKIISREEASGPVSEALAASAIAVVLVYIGDQMMGGRLAVGDFIAFSFAIGLLQDSVKKIQGGYIKLQQSAVALERLQSIMQNTSVVPQIPKPKPFPSDWQEITFKNVSFAFDQEHVLKNVNLRIRRGEIIALVGASGAGKSTLINLLPRFFDPTSGEISIGGVPIQDMHLKELRSRVALVSQDVFLFSDSIEKNIWSGDFSKTLTGVEHAARMANAHDFISRTKSNYQSRVGDRGSMLSGGEKQRISIARAIFKDAPILILDEATSALDSESELEVQKGLDSLMQGRTTLVIAHRLSTIAKADRILVLRKGEIIEEGSHSELLGRQGEYFRYYQLQANQFN